MTIFSKNLNDFTVILVLFLMTFNAYAQKANPEYQPLLTKGELPKEVITPSSIKYKSEIQKIDKKEKAKNRKIKSSFYLESNFGIDDLLQSGFVLYNDPLGKYVNQVADSLLVKNKTLRQKLKFYVVKTSIVNAFATNQGYIFVTMGLLSQLENEAQLGFILSHEIVHFEKQHALNFYVQAEKLDKASNQNSVLRAANFDKTLLKRTFAKEQETEADSAGVERFLLSNYDHTVIENVFDVLRYSYLPFDEVKFEKSFFEQTHIKFPESYQREKISPIKVDISEEDDKYSTHPNISKREKLINDRLAKIGNRKGKLFILPESKFTEVQTIARTELPLLDLHNEMYYSAIYNSYLLLKTNKEPEKELFYKKCIAKAMYCITKYHNTDRRYEGEIDSLEGEFQGLVHFFEKLKNSEINALAANYVWDLSKQNPKDTELKTISKDLLNELMIYHIKTAKDLEIKPEIKKEIAAKETENKDNKEKDKDNKQKEKDNKQKDKDNKQKGKDNKEKDKDTQEKDKDNKEKDKDTQEKDKDTQEKKPNSKYVKIKKGKDKKKEEKESEQGLDSLALTRQILSVWKTDTAFNAQIKRSQENAERWLKRKKYYESPEGRKEYTSDLAKKEQNGVRLGIDKIVIVNPGYVRLNAKKDYKQDYLLGETKQDKLIPIINQNAQLAGLKTTILDVTDLKPSDTEKFNEISLLNEWVSEQVDFEQLSITPGHRQAQIDAIAKKYGTKYFAWTGIVSVKKGTDPMAGLMTFLFFPYGIYLYAQPTEDTIFYTVVYNVETGEVNSVGYDSYNAKARKDLLNAHYYDIFKQIKSKSKSSK